MVGRALLLVAALTLLACADDDGAASPATTSAADAGSGPVTDDGRDDVLPFAEDEYAGGGDDALRVIVIGDSIVDGARAELHRALTDYRVAVAGAIGEGWAGGLRSDELGIDVVATLTDLYAGMDPDVVVLALGTNDAWKPELHVTESVPVLRSVAERFEGTCIVGVEVYEGITAEGFDPAEARAINDALAEVAHVLVDISGVAETSAFEPDHIHPLPDGNGGYAALVADGVDQCVAND
jgi:lysophospholipase L1-like esterase